LQELVRVRTDCESQSFLDVGTGSGILAISAAKLGYEPVRAIDLDPASSEYAQKTVQAETHFTFEDDGLAQDWHGRVWLNPPYHRELAPKFIEKLIVELGAGHVTEAIVLTNNSTDTAWFRAAATVCDAICFTTGRINFEVPNSKPVLPTQGQAFFYFGPRDERQGAKLARFVEVFAPIGLCLEPLLAAPF
jgi:predicted RNA methylase